MTTRYKGERNVLQQAQQRRNEESEAHTPALRGPASKQKKTSGVAEKQDESSATRRTKQMRKQQAEVESSDSSDEDMDAAALDGAEIDDKGGKKSQFTEVLKVYRKMFDFDWDLKELTNLRHNPVKQSRLEEDLTAGAFWFFVNTTFFSNDLQELVLDQSYDAWFNGLRDKLKTFRIQYNQIAAEQSDKEEAAQKEDNATNKACKKHKIVYDGEGAEPVTAIDAKQKLQIGDSARQLLDQPWSSEALHALFHVDKLVHKRNKFDRFKQYCRSLKLRLATDDVKAMFDDEEVMEGVRQRVEQVPKQPIFSVEKSTPTVDETKEPQADTAADPDAEIASLQRKIDITNFEKTIMLAERDLKRLQERNYTTLNTLHDGIKQKFENALAIKPGDEAFRDKKVYVPQQMSQYGSDFLAYVEPHFAQDMVNNCQWYSQTSNKFLMNINYPSKLQYDFLKELELAQQHRNDKRYQKIMQQMEQLEETYGQANEKEEGADDDQAANPAKQQERRQWFEEQLRLFNQKQSILVQDDACCAICNNGDYDDDNEIVFCARCSIPVHQQCFGLETVPENDWICNNCYTFGFQRGLMVKCILCPKRGGAMKPTNIFRSHEKYLDQKVRSRDKKTARHKLDAAVAQGASQPGQDEEAELLAVRGPDGKENWQCFKQRILQRLENNACLSELINREYSYKVKVYHDEIDDDLDPAALALYESQLDPKVTKLRAAKQLQEDLQLNFTKSEQKHHCIPEDYRDFIQRNEGVLSAGSTPITDSLYYWVHHSCSLWSPGPAVTPKTPVKMNRLDFSKFAVGCVICGRKGIEVGATVKCCKSECDIQFHVECAKRANYCMEIEKKTPRNPREKTFKIFCESHRPFKIIQEINEQNKKAIDDIQKFARTIEKCCEISKRCQLKPKKLLSKVERSKLIRQALQQRKTELISLKKAQQKQGRPKKVLDTTVPKKKKWREKDKRTLLERVKEKYLAIKKMRFNLCKVNPMIQETRRYQKELKRIQKAKEKRRKHELQLKQDLYFKQMLLENEKKRKEKGLRPTAVAGGVPDEGDQHMAVADVDEIQRKIDEETRELQQLQEQQMAEAELEELPTLQQLPEYYKFAPQPNIQELEWKVTLSRYDFPWQEIAFAPFSAKDCYKMYGSLVQDAKGFLQKVLGDKMKYQKMIRNQLQGLPTVDQLMNLQPLNPNPPKREDLHFFDKPATEVLPSAMAAEALPPADPLTGQAANLGTSSQPVVLFNPTAYCICRGTVISDIMIGCDSGEEKCPNGGWLHPQCTSDLRDLTKDQIDQIDQWFCQDCIAKQAEEAQPSQQAPASAEKRATLGDEVDKSESSPLEKRSGEAARRPSLIIRLGDDPQAESQLMPANTQPCPVTSTQEKPLDESIQLEASEQMQQPITSDVAPTQEADAPGVQPAEHQQHAVVQQQSALLDPDQGWAEQDEEQIVKDLLQLLESSDPAESDQVSEALLRDPRLLAYLTRQVQEGERELSAGAVDTEAAPDQDHEELARATEQLRELHRQQAPVKEAERVPDRHRSHHNQHQHQQQRHQMRQQQEALKLLGQDSHPVHQGLLEQAGDLTPEQSQLLSDLLNSIDCLQADEQNQQAAQAERQRAQQQSQQEEEMLRLYRQQQQQQQQAEARRQHMRRAGHLNMTHQDQAQSSKHQSSAQETLFQPLASKRHLFDTHKTGYSGTQPSLQVPQRRMMPGQQQQQRQISKQRYDQQHHAEQKRRRTSQEQQQRDKQRQSAQAGFFNLFSSHHLKQQEQANTSSARHHQQSLMSSASSRQQSFFAPQSSQQHVVNQAMALHQQQQQQSLMMEHSATSRQQLKYEQQQQQRHHQMDRHQHNVDAQQQQQHMVTSLNQQQQQQQLSQHQSMQQQDQQHQQSNAEGEMTRFTPEQIEILLSQLTNSQLESQLSQAHHGGATRGGNQQN